MADYEQKDNSGAIFKNDRKENEKQPDYRGTCVVDGVEKDISLWVTKSKAGKTYFSAKFKEAWKKDKATSNTASAEVDDDLPF
jgi:uncharacterized protein (DUF736 family)